MADVHLWARTEFVHGIGYIVTVSAVPAGGEARHTRALVDQQILESRDAATAARAEMLRAAGASVISRGDRVVDVVDD